MNVERGVSVEEQLARLRQAYLEALSERIAQIDGAWSRWKNSGETEAAYEFLRRIHGIAGSGGTYGAPELSEVAGSLESFVEPLLEQGQPLTATSSEFIEANLMTLRTSVQVRRASLPPIAITSNEAFRASSIPPALSLPPRSRHLVAFGFSDEAGVAVINSVAERVALGARSANSLSELEALLTDRPIAVLLEESAVASLANPLELLRLRKKFGKDSWVYSCKNVSFATRLTAARAGADLCLGREELRDMLPAILEQAEAERNAPPLRVLLVEDDAQLAQTYAAHLQAAGMITDIVTDPSQALTHSNDFGPEIVLLDIQMPGCTGLELAKILRQGAESALAMGIVFLSADKRWETYREAMDLGADDFVVKPVVGAQLVAAVAARGRRLRAMQARMARDSLTGLVNHATTSERLDFEVSRALRQGTSLSLAMIDLDHFKRINDKHGHAAGDRVLKTFARLVQGQVRRTDTVGRIGGEEFAIILPGADTHEAFRVVDQLRHLFSFIVHTGETPSSTLRATFSAGIAAVGAYPDAKSLLAAADRALYAAKRAGRNRVSLALEG